MPTSLGCILLTLLSLLRHAHSAAAGSLQWSFRSNSSMPMGTRVLQTINSSSIYVSCSNNAYCAVNTNDGSLIWNVTGFKGEVLSNDGSMVYGVDEKEHSLKAISTHDGSLKWTTHGAHHYAAGYTNTGTVVARNGDVYDMVRPVQPDNVTRHLAVFSSDTGIQKWSFDTKIDYPVYSKPVFSPDQSVVYVGNNIPCNIGGASLFAINTIDGSSKWTYSTWYPINASPLVSMDGSTVYFSLASEVSFGAMGSIVALNTKDGTVKWRLRTYNFQATLTFSLDETAIYYSSCPNCTPPSESPWNVTALNASDGSKLWTSFVPGRNMEVYGSLPILSLDGTALYTSMDINRDPSDTSKGPFVQYAINTSDGSKLWEYTVLQPIGETALSSDGLTLYFIGKQSYYNETIPTTTNYNESLYAINTKDGKGKWSFKLGTGNFTTFPFTDEGGVMFSLDRSMLFVGADLNKLSQYLFAFNTDS